MPNPQLYWLTRITNQTGQVVLTKIIADKDCFINLSNYTDGIYYFTMDNAKIAITKKATKQ